MHPEWEGGLPGCDKVLQGARGTSRKVVFYVRGVRLFIVLPLIVANRYYEDLFAKDAGTSVAVNVAAKAYRAVSRVQYLDLHHLKFAFFQLSLKTVRCDAINAFPPLYSPNVIFSLVLIQPN